MATKCKTPDKIQDPVEDGIKEKNVSSDSAALEATAGGDRSEKESALAPAEDVIKEKDGDPVLISPTSMDGPEQEPTLDRADVEAIPHLEDMPLPLFLRRAEQRTPPSVPGAYGVANSEVTSRNPFLSASLGISMDDSLHRNSRESQEDVESESQEDVESPSDAVQERLAVADPVDDGNDALPTATEYEERKDVTRPSLVASLAAITFVALLLLVFILPFSIKKASDVKTSDAMDPQIPEPIIGPSDHILALLPQNTKTTISSSPDSPQSQAFTWVLEDPNLDQYGDYRIQQRFALAVLYYATSGGRWRNNTGWLSYQLHECQWFQSASFAARDLYRAFVHDGYLRHFDPGHQICPQEKQGIVQHLWMFQNALKGSIPFPELSLMTELKTMSFDLDEIEAIIPPEIGKLTKLEGISLSPMVGGSIPTEMGLLTNLVVWLSEYQHKGTLPDNLMKSLTNLEYLMLGYNPELHINVSKFTPDGMPKLRWLTLDQSGATGTIPTEVGQFSQLEWLVTKETNVSGTLPTELGLVTTLELFTILNCNFEGTIPTELGLLTSSYLISLRNNALTGTIPTELGLLTSISYTLNLQDNHLTGTIPTELGNLHLSEELSVLGNQLTGPIPSELGKLSRMANLGLSNNSLTGTIPEELALVANSSTLYLLELDGNSDLSGVIPEELCAINSTCLANSYMNWCEERSGFLFDCTEQLCGCDCPCGDA